MSRDTKEKILERRHEQAARVIVGRAGVCVTPLMYEAYSTKKGKTTWIEGRRVFDAAVRPEDILDPGMRYAFHHLAVSVASQMAALLDIIEHNKEEIAKAKKRKRK